MATFYSEPVVVRAAIEARSGDDREVVFQAYPEEEAGGGSYVIIGSDLSKLGFYGFAPIIKPTVTGCTGGNQALDNLLDQLATLGLIWDQTTD
jgi:hypothetical protein